MKFLCTCGVVMRDQSDYLPHKAHLVADEDFFDLHDVIDQLIAQGPDDPDALTRLVPAYWRELYQCPDCGRLYVAARGELHEFVPAIEGSPRDLLAGRRSALFHSECWMDLSDAANSSNRLAWEQELRTELSTGHVLDGRRWVMFARRTDRDDAVLHLASGGYAVVHLTWSGRTEQPPWPSTTVYQDLRDLTASYRGLDA